MSIDQKKHTSIAAGEAPKQGALAKALLSINDVVPTANATEQAQILEALSGTEFPVTPARPLATTRADARPLHQIEVSRGGAFVPTSGVLSFATKSAADTWAQANAALLTPGDRCVAGSADYRWDGGAWRPAIVASGDIPAQAYVFMQVGTAVSSVDGSSGAQDVAFPMKFPNAHISTVANDGDASGSRRLRGVTNPTQSGFRAIWEPGSTGLQRINWVAVGY